MNPAAAPASIQAKEAERVFLRVRSVAPDRIEVLREWRAELLRLIERFEICPARTVNYALSVQLSSAIRGAHEDIDEACAEGKAEMMERAIQALTPYFDRRGDARLVAERFPAMIAARHFLRGPMRAESLGMLARQARETVAIIGRVLAMGEVWSFTALSMPIEDEAFNPAEVDEIENIIFRENAPCADSERIGACGGRESSFEGRKQLAGA